MTVVMCRLTRFSDDWPTLEKWFAQLSVLKQVDAAAAPDDVVAAVDAIVQQCLDKDAAGQPHVSIAL